MVKVPPSSRLSRLSVSSSALSEALLPASGTEAKSADASWSVPNTPAFLLKTSVHLLPVSFRAQMLYLPLGTVTSPKVRSASVENVVESSAPRRQKPPTFKRPSNCCIVRPLSDGRPYSTETVLPPRSSLAVPRGLPCARQAVPAKAAITITLHAALLDRFISVSFFSVGQTGPAPPAALYTMNGVGSRQKGNLFELHGCLHHAILGGVHQFHVLVVFGLEVVDFAGIERL